MKTKYLKHPKKTIIMKILNEIRTAIIILLSLSGPMVVFGQQDPIYSQYIFNMQTVNPAYVGSWQTMGFVALDREQWLGITGHPTTQSFSFQTPILNQNVGVGLDMVIDKLGSERRVMLGASYSYRISIDEATSLRFGLKAGFTNYNNNLPTLQPFPDGQADPVLQNAITSKFMPNIGTGLFLSSSKYYLSLSLPKLFETKINENSGYSSRMSEAREYYLLGGVVFNVSDNLKFKPTFMTKAAVGSPFQYDLSANFLMAEKFWLGGVYRSGDAVGVVAQWIINNRLRIGYAIDFTTTDLKNYHNGVHELMLSYEIAFIKKEYTSPRYF
jgi:type IX secretion system PorP/SprF family membrane protein